MSAVWQGPLTLFYPWINRNCNSECWRLDLKLDWQTWLCRPGVLRDWVWQGGWDVMCDVVTLHCHISLEITRMSHAHSLAQRYFTRSLCHKWSENEGIEGPVFPNNYFLMGKVTEIAKVWPINPSSEAVSPGLTFDHETDNGIQGKWQDKYIFRSGIFYTGGGSASKTSPPLFAKLWVNVFIFISPHQSFLTARGWRYLGLNIATNIWLARFLDKPTFV